ncbi:MAG: hypothetical protein QOE70_4552 [Chthoniobacter sp.]|nr:hypothetical protein [Chthoniobacter sp.]
MKARWHLLALVVVAFGVGLLFLQEPGFGDDLTYWSFAFDLHERGLAAWQKGSFHDLRWPVWGICWVLQSIFGFGLTSYYGEPLLYLAGGAALGFGFGKKLTNSAVVAWACGVAFLFHPLLDTVCYRPMPDLSEGVLGAAVMLAWWALMNAEGRGRTLLAAAAMGAGIFVIEANRVTGVFIVPVVILCTLLFFPRRFGWIVVAGAIAAALYAGECLFYKRLFHDWLHDLTANAGNKGAKGTEFPNPWSLPFRFFDTLWKGNPLAPPYCLFGAAGTWVAWRRHGILGRVIVVWFAALYLLYACAPQSLWPYRPLVRDADRFLCAIVVPMSVLAALGLMASCTWIAQRSKLAAGDARRPIQTGVFLTVLLFAATSRDRFDLGFVPEMRRYLAALPEGTRVFSHKAMREIIFLVDAKSARRFTWTAPNEILHRTDKLEAQAAGCTEFWYARKLVWLNTRKALEKREIEKQPALGSYFETPERDWTLTGLFAKGDNPDLIFYRRRQPDSPPAQILGPEAVEWQQLIPALPARLHRAADGGAIQAEWPVPANLKGRLARFEFVAASPQVEALTIRLRFHSAASPKPQSEYLLKPYLYAGGGMEFFALPIPADADTCQVHLKLGKGAKEVVFTGFRAVVEAAPPTGSAR